MITGPQRRVLAALRDITVDGWPATVREIGDRVGLSSPSTTWTHLNSLERAGFAKRHPRADRGGWLPTQMLDEQGRDVSGLLG